MIVEYGKLNSENKLTHINTIYKLLNENVTQEGINSLLSDGWYPIQYDIPEYNRDTHVMTGYTFKQLQSIIVAVAIIEEKPEDIEEFNEEI